MAVNKKNDIDRFINIAAGGKKLNSEIPRLQEILPLEINRVEIEKDDYKDRQGLADRIISEINKLAKKYYNITDYLK